MTLLIPLLMRLTSLFERGKHVEDVFPEDQKISEEVASILPEKK